MQLGLSESQLLGTIWRRALQPSQSYACAVPLWLNHINLKGRSSNDSMTGWTDMVLRHRAWAQGEISREEAQTILWLAGPRARLKQEKLERSMKKCMGHCRHTRHGRASQLGFEEQRSWKVRWIRTVKTVQFGRENKAKRLKILTGVCKHHHSVFVKPVNILRPKFFRTGFLEIASRGGGVK